MKWFLEQNYDVTYFMVDVGQEGMEEELNLKSKDDDRKYRGLRSGKGEGFEDWSFKVLS